MELICPVCNRRNDTARVQTCEQCAADLRPLIRLRTLPLESCELGMRAIDRGNWDAALSHLLTAAALDPDSSEIRAALERSRREQAAARDASAQAGAPRRRPAWWNWISPSVGFALGAGLLLTYQAMHHNGDSRGAIHPPPALPPMAAKAAAPDVPVTVPYKVRAGDSLWRIARRSYGSGAFWPVLRDANAGRLVKMRAGDTLLLPEVVIRPKTAVR